jgi:signal recognition particle receptor subunit beta
MIDNLAEYNLTLDNIPWVLQYNKRDLANAMSVERMERDLNIRGIPSFEAVASEGLGVFATLKAISKLILNRLQ